MRGGAWWQDADYVASHYEPDVPEVPYPKPGPNGECGACEGAGEIPTNQPLDPALQEFATCGLCAGTGEHEHEWGECIPATEGLKHAAPMVCCPCGEVGWRVALLTA